MQIIIVQRGLIKHQHIFLDMHLLQNGQMLGVDVNSYKKFYGHSSSKMTDHYIEMSGIDLKKDFAIYNPLEKYANHKKQKIKLTKP